MCRVERHDTMINYVLYFMASPSYSTNPGCNLRRRNKYNELWKGLHKSKLLFSWFTGFTLSVKTREYLRDNSKTPYITWLIILHALIITSGECRDNFRCHEFSWSNWWAHAKQRMLFFCPLEWWKSKTIVTAASCPKCHYETVQLILLGAWRDGSCDV